MTIQELATAVKDIPNGSQIWVKKKPVHMNKYGKSTKFIPRTVKYSSYQATFRGLSKDGKYLLTQTESGRNHAEYFSKIDSIRHA